MQVVAEIGNGVFRVQIVVVRQGAGNRPVILASYRLGNEQQAAMRDLLLLKSPCEWHEVLRIARDNAPAMLRGERQLLGISGMIHSDFV